MIKILVYDKDHGMDQLSIKKFSMVLQILDCTFSVCHKYNNFIWYKVNINLDIHIISKKVNKNNITIEINLLIFKPTAQQPH